MLSLHTQKKKEFTFNFQVYDQILEICNVLVKLRGLAFVSAFVRLRHIGNDKSQGCHRVFAAIVGIARAKDPASHIPSQARLWIATHFAFQSESG